MDRVLVEDVRFWLILAAQFPLLSFLHIQFTKLNVSTPEKKISWIKTDEEVDKAEKREREKEKKNKKKTTTTKVVSSKQVL